MRSTFWRSSIWIVAAGLALGILGSIIHTYVTLYTGVNNLVMPNGEVIGGDFICFHIAGKIFNVDVTRLYDFQYVFQLHREALAQVAGEQGYLPFIYPPLIAYFFSFLAYLPMVEAHLVWLGISVVLALSSVILVARGLQLSTVQTCAVGFLCLAFAPFSIYCLAGGQLAAVGMLCVAGVYYGLKTKRDVLAGLFLSLSYYKPPLFLGFVIISILQKRWRMLTSFLVSGAGLIALSLLLVGIDGFVLYLHQASKYVYGRELVPGMLLPTDQGVGLLAFFMGVFSSMPAQAWGVFLLSAVGLVLAARRYSSDTSVDDARFDVRFALEVSASLLISLQLINYDIAIYFVPLILVGLSLYRRSSALKKYSILSLLLIFGFFLSFTVESLSLGAVEIKSVLILQLLWIVALFGLVSKESQG